MAHSTDSRRHRGRAAVLFALVLILGGSAAAQEIPGSVEPGQLEKRFDIQPRLREKPGPAIESPEAPAVPAPPTKEMFTLAGVEVTGVTVYGANAFEPLYRDLIHKEVRLADFNAVARQIAERYRHDGYTLTRAAPPVRRDGDIVVIRVIEGYISQVSVEGEMRGDPDLLQAYGKKITDDRPTRVANLERYVLLISDLPGVTVRPYLEPVDIDAGEYKLILAMQHRNVAAFLQADNRGSEFVGPYQLWAGAAFNSVFGLYENSRLRFITTPEAHDLIFFDAFHSEPVDSEGTIVTVGGSFSKSAPGHTLAPLDIRSRNARAEAQIAHPFIRSRHLDVYGTARFTYQDSVSDRLDTRAFTDKLRVVRAGAIVSFDDGADGRDWSAMEVSQGLDILGASASDSLTTSRPGADAGFTKFTIDFSRYQRVMESWGLLVLGTGQLATGRLLTAEAIGMGGERIGRAYDAGEIIGQDGIGGRLEIQRDFWFPDIIVKQLQLYAFYDIGAVWNTERQSLTSTGGGVRFQFTHGVFAYLEGSQPLTRPVLAEQPHGKDPRLFFTVRAEF